MNLPLAAVPRRLKHAPTLVDEVKCICLREWAPPHEAWVLKELRPSPSEGGPTETSRRDEARAPGQSLVERKDRGRHRLPMRLLADVDLYLHPEPDALRSCASAPKHAGACVTDATTVWTTLVASSPCCLANLDQEYVVFQSNLYAFLELRPKLQIGEHERGTVEGPMCGVALLNAMSPAPWLDFG